MTDSPDLNVRIFGDASTINRLITVLRGIDPRLDLRQRTRRDGGPSAYVQMRMPVVGSTDSTSAPDSRTGPQLSTDQVRAIFRQAIEDARADGVRHVRPTTFAREFASVVEAIGPDRFGPRLIYTVLHELCRPEHGPLLRHNRERGGYNILDVPEVPDPASTHATTSADVQLEPLTGDGQPRCQARRFGAQCRKPAGHGFSHYASFDNHWSLTSPLDGPFGPLRD
ncbi:hypothetical protein [Catenuloplanes japonicus]|uniref:hypothetical protein n=1 Tax=Catenuloplanes japonicus TaxID=33876 RepID=UPI0005247843|nr:hypothetical protein [Catenuloplanes japonicus]